MLCHLLSIPLGFLGPLIIWLMKKDQSKFVDDQGKEALNFVITVMIASFLTCGIASLVGIVFLIIGAIEANKGVWYRYPFSIRFIK